MKELNLTHNNELNRIFVSVSFIISADVFSSIARLYRSNDEIVNVGSIPFTLINSESFSIRIQNCKSDINTYFSVKPENGRWPDISGTIEISCMADLYVRIAWFRNQLSRYKYTSKYFNCILFVCFRAYLIKDNLHFQ